MAKSSTGHHWRLMCRSDDGCGWSRHVVVPADEDARPFLLLVLRAHADTALHGRAIEGVAVIVLRHP